jgi:hypothetical protein
LGAIVSHPTSIKLERWLLLGEVTKALTAQTLNDGANRAPPEVGDVSFFGSW